MEAKLRVLPEAEFNAWLSDREQKRLAVQTAHGGGS
jgi:heme/copper-type cytochrome/quinol oxidase subunit 2